MAIKLSYCQLIRLILSYIGGQRLAQSIATQIAGSPAIVVSGIIPKELQELKALIDSITQTVAALSSVINDGADMFDKLNQELFQNPIKAAYDAAIAAIDAKLALETPGSAEYVELTEFRSTLVTFKNNTDILSGVTAASSAGSPGECSIMDLLGDACNPDSSDLTLVTINDLYKGLKNGDLIKAVADKITTATGVTALLGEISNLRTTLSQFNTNFKVNITKARVKAALTAQINNIVYNLLAGCGNNVLDLTLKPTIKEKLAPYTALLQSLQPTDSYIDNTGAESATFGTVVKT